MLGDPCVGAAPRQGEFTQGYPRNSAVGTGAVPIWRGRGGSATRVGPGVGAGAAPVGSGQPRVTAGGPLGHRP